MRTKVGRVEVLWCDGESDPRMGLQVVEGEVDAGVFLETDDRSGCWEVVSLGLIGGSGYFDGKRAVVTKTVSGDRAPAPGAVLAVTCEEANWDRQRLCVKRA